MCFTRTRVSGRPNALVTCRPRRQQVLSSPRSSLRLLGSPLRLASHCLASYAGLRMGDELWDPQETTLLLGSRRFLATGMAGPGARWRSRTAPRKSLNQ
jgi:hypothetical protein